MSGGQKFLSRNRAPRVQIEYDVELYGAEKKVQLPFVMGVMSDLAGKAEQVAIADRKFLEIDVDTFDDRMAAMAPKARFSVPNTLTGEGSIPVDLTFRKMSDFSPEAIARNVETLRPLLEARQQLRNLMAYMDGKSGAEALIENILAEPTLLQALAGREGGAEDMEAALDSLRAKLPSEPMPTDTTEATLATLAAEAPDDETVADHVSDVLAGMDRAVDDAAPDDTTDAVLASLPDAPAEKQVVSNDDVLTGVDAGRTDDSEHIDKTGDVLSGIARVEDTQQEDGAADVLAAVERVTAEEEIDASADVLASLPSAPEDTAPAPAIEDVLGTVEGGVETEEGDGAADVLAGLDLNEPDTTDEEDSLDDILSGLEPAGGDPESERGADDILADLELETEAPVPDPESEVGDILGGLEDVSDDDAGDGEGLDDILADLEPAPFEAEEETDLGELLSDLTSDAGMSADAPQELDSVLADVGASEPGDAETDQEPREDAGTLPVEPEGDGGLDALLDDIGATEIESPADEAPEDTVDLDALLSDPGGEGAGSDTSPDEKLDASAAPGGEASVARDEDEFEAILAHSGQDENSAEDDDLDALLSELGGDDAPDDPGELDVSGEPPDGADDAETDDDLDSLLAETVGDEMPDTEAAADDDDLDALLADLEPIEPEEDESEASELDALLADDQPEITDDLGEAVAEPKPPAQSPFGIVTQPRPERAALNRPTFRMALFGDFTGRASRGVLETGAALAGKQGVPLDVDTVEDVIESFATKLTLPIGKDGTGINVKLGELDDLHPDELYEAVEVFDGLSGLRQQLGVASMADKARARLKAWSEEFGTPVKLPKRSAGSSVPPNLKLSDFQALIGDVSRSSQPSSPIDDLVARIVGPHIVAEPDADAAAMTAAVDEAIGSAMRLILHHPDFQSLEAQWRSLDLLARRIETGSDLQIVLFDVSAEELAADLAAHEDLGESGLFGLLTNALDPEQGAGGFSALIGLYTFEETPTHAEVLARIGQVAAHVDAPFFAAMSPGYLDTAKEDRHPLVAKSWDALRATPEAAYLGLASPRFLLRLPYGAKSDPISSFDFEEFSRREGLSGMLWANPAVLVAILLAGTYTKDGKAMDLGSLMSLGDLPFHYVADRYGDQVALPCTERNLTSDPAQATLARGYMPVVWMKGRNEVRLGSFRALSGDEIAGPWSDTVLARSGPSPAPATAVMSIEMETDSGAEDLGVSDADAAEDMDAELDALLAGFDDDGDDSDATGDDDLDAELAALLEGL